MYQYKAKLIKVVDGDTVDAMIDCGFSTFKKERIRLFGINTPECRTRDKEEKKRGLAAKARLKQLIKEGKNYFDTNVSSHHHFYDEENHELTDIENNKIELKKFPTPPKGKSIKDVNVIINIDNDNQKH